MKNTIVTKKDYLGRPTYSVEEKKEFLELWRESINPTRKYMTFSVG